ncbi:PP2C family protein-serine/threonine phosphatase [Streptomyces sp. NPDC046831]|uniref:PP2C family protein-serine/threonine phosphatase n=1 Tax=Streptomyces sp. NPDC046831 TaxID=3154805 RepID=UPI003407B123
MIRIRAGTPRSARSRSVVRASAREGLPAWPPGARRPGRPPGGGPGHPPLRRALALGPPAAWGALGVTYKLACPFAQQTALGARLVSSAVFLAVGTGLVLHVRRTLLRELRQARAVAGAAQSVLLRPLPSRVGGLHLAAAQLSADRGAAVGGDLYEVIATEYGVRVVMGDVRGHGLGALATVAAVLGSFREAVHDEVELAGVLRRLDRAMTRHLRERALAEHPSNGRPPDSPVAEEFVTVLLLEIDADGAVRALNCGHPWPYRLSGARADPLADADPLPPLGAFPLPSDLPAVDCGRLRPGDGLVLYTDGVEDARDAHGRFFPLPAALAETAGDLAVSPQAVLRGVLTRLLRHTGRRPADDVAVLVLRNDRGRSACAGLAGVPAARHGTPHPQSTGRL